MCSHAVLVWESLPDPAKWRARLVGNRVFLSETASRSAPPVQALRLTDEGLDLILRDMALIRKGLRRLDGFRPGL